MTGLALTVAVAGVPVALATTSASAASAAPTAVAPPATRLHTWDDPMGAFTARGGITESFSAPAVGDITGDGRADVVVAGMDGDVVARRADGSVIWRRNYDGWGVQSSPVLRDLSGDGRADILLGLMGGTVAWLDGINGDVVRSFAFQPSGVCPVGTDPYCKLPGAFGTPTVADITGDGVDDIIATNWDHQVYAWRKDGSLIFRKYLLDTVWSSPVVADLDRNGSREIVLGGTISYGGKQGGYIWVLNGDGSNYGSYPKYLPGQSIWSTPALVDLDRDRDLDLVVGTGGDFAGSSGYRVYAFEAHSGAALAGWPVTTPGNVDASPAVGDIDGDATLEVVVASEGGYVQAYDANGSLQWRVCNAYGDSVCGPGYPTHGTAVIADVDADGDQEVVSAMDKHLRVYDGDAGTRVMDDPIQGYLEPTTFAPAGSATVAQVDGRAWIVQSGIVDANRDGRRGSGDVYRTWVWQSATALGASAWPTFKHDAARTGLVGAGTQTWAPFATSEGFVTQQYLDFLGRRPDAGGLAYWSALMTNGRASGSKLVEQFLASAEFKSVVGPVVRLSFGLTGRPPTDYAVTRSRIDAVRGSTPLVAVADQMASAAPFASMSNTQYVTTVFTNTYGRPPTTAERSDGVARLMAGTSRGGYLVDQLASGYGAALNANEVSVAMTYMAMLRRVPDTSGFDYWVDKLDRGTSIASLGALFQFASEYVRRF